MMKLDFNYDEEFVKWIINLRRDFHKSPEISFKEFNTQKKIISILDSLNIKNEKIANTGVIGFIDSGKNGKTIAIRTDMDALMIKEEKTNKNNQYRSKHEGIMHACGHDGHMAMVLGAAKKLQENRHLLKGNVKLIFQPAEETPPGGAVEVIKMGGLNNVDAIIGCHLFSDINFGDICMKEGAFMASNCKYNISIYGKSGHHSNPKNYIDPIEIASKFISTIKNDLEKALSPNIKYVFGFGTINGGEQFNQTPAQVNISGSYRMLDKQYIHLIEDIMKTNLDKQMEIHYQHSSDNLPKYKLDVVYGYPVLVNDKKFTKRAARVLKTKMSRVIENYDTTFASEDFAYYLESIPGTFLFLGSGNKEKGIVYGNHSEKFDIDEDILIKGVEIHYYLANDFLNSPEEYLTTN